RPSGVSYSCGNCQACRRALRAPTVRGSGRQPRRRLAEIRMSTLAVLPEPYVAAHDPAVHRRTTLAGHAGNVMEWYDFAVYGYFAPVIGRHFFPAEDPAASLIAAFGVF